MKTLNATVRASGEGERRWFCGGGLMTWKATAAETGGAFLLFEDEMDQGKVTPLHLHPEVDETFYLLDGEISLYLDGEHRTLRAGDVAVMPRGVPHAFKVISPTTRLLCLHTPGGDEEFYRLASEPAPEGSRATPVDFGRIGEAARATGAIEILGPPPFDTDLQPRRDTTS